MIKWITADVPPAIYRREFVAVEAIAIINSRVASGLAELRQSLTPEGSITGLVRFADGQLAKNKKTPYQVG